MYIHACMCAESRTARESARIGNFSDFKIRFTRLSRRIEATDGCYDNNRDTGCASRVSKAMGVLSPGVFILVLHKCALGALGQVRLPAISCVEQSAESLHKEHTHSVLPRRGTTLFSLLFTINIYIFDSRFTFTSLETSLLSTENFQNFQHSDNKCNGYISSVSSTVVPQLSGYLYEQETVRIIRRLSHRRAEGRVEGTWEGVFPLISSFLSRSTCRHSSSRTERHLDGGCRTVPEGSCG